MNQFCQECGAKLEGSVSHCTECGHKVARAPKSSIPAPGSSRKPPAKKQKIIGGIIAAIVISFVGLYMWGNSQVSAKGAAQRFASAIQENDPSALQKVSIIHHGKFISKAEANALLSLAKEDPDYIENNVRAMGLGVNAPDDNLFTVVEDGKWLGIFKRHSVLVTPQYARLTLPFEGIKSTFNGKEMPVKDSEAEEMIYGPMAPGIYEVESSFSGEYTEVHTKEKVGLSDTYGDAVTYKVDLDANYVEISLHGSAPVSKAYIKINDKQVQFDKDKSIKKFGPVKLDGSTSVTPVVELPWGTVESDKVAIEDSKIEFSPNTVNKQLSETLSKLILSYGEEYVQAHAAWDVSKFSTITSDMKSNFKSNFDYNRNNDELFSGKLEKVELDLDSISYSEASNGTRVELPAKFTFQADTFYRGDKADLGERIDFCEIGLIFNEKEKSWKVNDCSPSWSDGSDMEATVALDGSKKLYSASPGTATASAPAQENTTEKNTGSSVPADEIENFMVDYNMVSVAAINMSDFSMVEDMVATSGPRYKEQRDYIDYTEAEGIYEDFLSTQVESIKEMDGNTWEVVTIEEFMIHKNDSSSKKKFRTKNVIKRINGDLQLYKLIETKQI